MQPRTSLRRVLDDLGETLLDLVRGNPDNARDLGGVVIRDPLDEPVLPRQALVLAVGVHDQKDIIRLLESLATRDAAGLVVRAPIAMTEDLAAAVDRSGVALLELSRGASWTQLAAMLRALLAEGDVGEAGAESLGGLPSGDLFAVANAIAALIDAPVTIEDRSSRVLAFSGRQDEADQSRVETILGRQVPERYRRDFEKRGVFRHLYRSERPIFVEQIEPTTGDPELPRMAIAVRAGDQVLGSIWAAVRGPLSQERTQALCDAARLVALHMLRLRAGADVGRRLRADLVSTALEGGPGATEAVARLRLAGQPVAVLALAVVDHDRGDPSLARDAQLAAERQRISDAFAIHLTAVHPQAACALVSDVTYGVLPVSRDASSAADGPTRIAADFLNRTGERVRAVIGIGPPDRDAPGLARSRTGADRALRVLQESPGTRRVAPLADVHLDALLLELSDRLTAEPDEVPGPLTRLLDYDDRHGTCLVDTLRAWLEAFGDVAAASSSVGVHPNTFRYRLRRIAEVGVIELGDPDSRFAAMLQLRLMGVRSHRAARP